jgi:methyl-accepting chemotaxis protein
MTVTFTQTIENVWMRAKRKLKRQFGTSRDLFRSYIHEFIWRNKFASQNTFRLELLTMKHILGKVLKPKNKTYKSSSTQLEKAAEMYAGTSKQLAESNRQMAESISQLATALTTLSQALITVWGPNQRNNQ